jgi:putative ABC transport system permease protein
MNTFLQDLKYGFRILIKNPAFTAVAILTLALGIGANTAIFSVVNAVLLRPLPYPEPERLAVIWETEPSGPGELFPDTGPDFLDWQAQNHVFEGVAAVTISGATLTGSGEPLQLRGLEISPNAFRVLGVQPLQGRTFAPDEGPSGRDRVVILSYGLWQGTFGGEQGLVGKKITLDGEAHEVVGIMSPDLRFPAIWGRQPQFWKPIKLDEPNWKKERGNHWLWVLARTKKDVSLSKATAEMEILSTQIAKQYPRTNTGVIARVKGLHEQLTGDVRPVLLVLFSAVGFLLLIACVNVANLLLGKSVGRNREIAIRLAVGSGTLRLVRQLLTESVLLFLLGGLAGMIVGFGAMRLLVSAAPSGYLPDVISIHLDTRVFAFTFLVAFITGTLAGLVPALHASRVNLNDMLKESGSAVAAPHNIARRLLTAGEIAMALVMLIGAGLAIKSLVRLLGVELGFDPQQVVTARVPLPDKRYPKESQQAAFYQSLQERVRSLPGVVSAAAASQLPLNGGSNGVVYIEGQPAPKDMWSSPLVWWCEITSDYFRTMRIPFLGGRDFLRTDTPDAPPVAIINETMARRFWSGQDAVGRHFKHSPEDKKWITVVGVVGDVRESGLDMPATPEAYFPQAQSASSYLALIVRTANDPLSQVSAIRGVIHSLDKDLPLIEVQTLADLVSESSQERRFVTLLLGLFAAVGLVLASVGIYGVVSYSVAQRTREIGIRMAFGAGIGSVVNMVLGEGLKLVLIGVGTGIAGAWALTRYLTKLLFGVRPTDPATFVGVAFLLTCVALAACYVPARRASRVDPMVALRCE